MIRTAHIGISYNCNMHCKHCFVDIKRDGNIFYEHYKKVIHDLYNEGLYMLFYTYGEPLMSEFFFDIAKYVNKMHICQVLMTNGYKIDNEDIVNRITECGIKQVFISIDSLNKEQHDKNRKTKNAWEKAVHAIKLLVKSEMITGIACTVTEDNVKEIKQLYEFAFNEGVNNISFLRCRENGKIVNFKDEDLYYNSIREIVEKNRGQKLRLRFHDITLIPIFKEMHKKEIIDDSDYNYYQTMCICHKMHNVNIAPNGDVFRCDFAIVPVGNIMNNDISSILNSNNDCRCTCL